LNRCENHLIELLPRKDRGSLLSACEPVQLVLSQVIGERGTPARHLYFPTSGYVSLLSIIENSPGVEVGMVGCEGVLGAQFALGVSASPSQAVVQGAGEAWRIGAPAFRRELAGSPALQRALHRYLYVLMMQFVTSAACLRFHQVGPRLARWLLMSQDRAQSDTFAMTQDFLSHMLGVRRVGVTAAASALKRRGLIEYRRGVMRVLDRPGLEAAACGCYASDRRAYAQTLG
jgi:CRP-like cAMP-binding protein